MKKFPFFIILFLLVLLVNCATEQKTIQPSSVAQERFDAPIWNVGDSWRYRYSDMKEWQYRVEKVEEDSYVVDDYGVKKYFDKKTLRLVAETDFKGARKRVDSAAFIDFPINVGKKWEKVFTATPTGGSMDVTYVTEYKVISYEDVTVPAGKFKAFKIELKQTNYGGSFNSGKAYLWYSPEVKYVVKIGHEEIPYWRGIRNFSLIRFELKDKQSSPPKTISSPQNGGTTTKPVPVSPSPSTHKQGADIPSKSQPLVPDKREAPGSVTSSPSTNIVVVTGTSANIRSGAGNEFPIVVTVKQGDKLTLLGEYGQWFNVRLENGQEGWIHSRFVKE